jgi:hypothetical protein
MSIDVTWPIKKSERTLMLEDCLSTHFSSDGVSKILSMHDNDQQTILNVLNAAGFYVNKKLIK